MSIYYSSQFPPPGPANYAWRIGRDHLFNAAEDARWWNGAGAEGPSDAPEDLLTLMRPGNIRASLESGLIHQFRMLDDDGILYYSGYVASWETDPESGELRMLTPDEMDERAAFGPLNDYGTPNAGAVEIQYKNAETGEWETM